MAVMGPCPPRQDKPPHDRSRACQEGRRDQRKRRRRQRGRMPLSNRTLGAQHASRSRERGEDRSGPWDPHPVRRVLDLARRSAVERRRARLKALRREAGGKREEGGKARAEPALGPPLRQLPSAVAATEGGPGWGGGRRREAPPDHQREQLCP